MTIPIQRKKQTNKQTNKRLSDQSSFDVLGSLYHCLANFSSICIYTLSKYSVPIGYRSRVTVMATIIRFRWPAIVL